MRPEYVIEGFDLPHGSLSSEQLVYCMRRCALQRLKDLKQRIRLAGGVGKGCENEVYMVGHDHSGMQP